MAETKLDITGSTAVAQKELDKLTKSLASVREQVRQLNTQSKESKSATDSWSAGMERLKTQNDRWAQGMAKLQAMQPQKTVAGMRLSEMHEAVSGLGQMAGSLLGIGSAVGITTAAYSRWHAKVDEIIHSHTDLQMSIVRTLAEAGKLSMGPEVEKWSKSQKGATPEQAMAAIGGVQASGETLSNERTMAVATEIAKLSPTGIDLTRAGAQAADVADVLGEGTSAEGVVNVTVGMRQNLRQKMDLLSGPKVQRQMENLKRGGMTGEDALANAMLALQSEGGAEALNVLDMKPGQRNLEQKKMVKDVFSPENVAKARADLQSFKTSNLASKELASLGSFGAGREALGEQGVKLQEAATTEQYGPLASERQRVQAFARNRAYQRNFGLGVFADLAGGSYSPFRTAGDLLQGQEGAGISQVNTMRGNGTISDQKADEMIAALRAAASASREAAKSNRALNVDRHTE